jgi:nucleotide-binding universal stress UspA family protein
MDIQDRERLGRETLRAAEERARDLVGDDVPLTTELAVGAVVASIVTAAEHARTIVLEHREPSGLRRVVTRSCASGVAARADIPVISVPVDWSDPTPADEASVVTVGVDIPERCRAVLAAGAHAALARGATLRILHTWWFPSVYDDAILPHDQNATWKRRVHEEIKAALHDLGDHVADLPLRIDTRHGHAAEALIAASHDSILLVVGRHDPHVPFGSHLGPVARAVVRDATCPVLLANPRASAGTHKGVSRLMHAMTQPTGIPPI